MKSWVFLFIIVGLPVLPQFVTGQTTIDPEKPFAYSGNAGWIDFSSETSGVGVGETFLYGNAHSANVGWINFGDGSPENGQSYSNNSSSDFGVNRDRVGNFSGYAYSGNIGWINFSWAGLGDPNRPRLDPLTGEFFGYAYSGNIGWILLGTDRLLTALVRGPDSDGDGISDDWEETYFPGLDVAGIGTDFDGDGQSDAAEAVAGTDPTDNESYLRIVSYSLNEGITMITLTFTSNPQLFYKIEYGDSLTEDWLDSGFGLFNPDAGAATSRSFSFAANSSQFFRVVAVKPPIQ